MSVEQKKPTDLYICQHWETCKERDNTDCEYGYTFSLAHQFSVSSSHDYQKAYSMSCGARTTATQNGSGAYEMPLPIMIIEWEGE